VPVIATDCGGAKEVVRDPSLRFQLADSEQLAALLLKAVLDKPVNSCLEKFIDSTVQLEFESIVQRWKIRFV